MDTGYVVGEHAVQQGGVETVDVFQNLAPVKAGLDIEKQRDIAKDDIHVDQGSFEPLALLRKGGGYVDRQGRRADTALAADKSDDFPFTGLLTCGECGGAITAQYGKGNGGTYIYYRCSKKFGKCAQPYMRDESMKEQISVLLQKASLPESWAGPAFAQLDRWEEEERGKLRSFAQKRARSISEIQEKLDRLVGGFLDGIIDRDTYLAKKEKLIRQKIRLEQDQTGFGEGASQWVEPMREWLEAAHKAGKLAFSDDYPGMKQLLEQIGTNRQVSQKKVEVVFVRPFSRLLRAKALWGQAGGCVEGKSKVLSSEVEGSPILSG